MPRQPVAVYTLSTVCYVGALAVGAEMGFEGIVGVAVVREKPLWPHGAGSAVQAVATRANCCRVLTRVPTWAPTLVPTRDPPLVPPLVPTRTGHRARPRPLAARHCMGRRTHPAVSQSPTPRPRAL
eukprot:1500121-Prymnesium_polylepis.1